MHVAVERGRLTHLKARELHLEELVQRKLNSDVGEAQEGGGQAGVEGSHALVCIHFAKCVEGIFVMPWRAVLLRGAGTHLRHEPRFDDPDGVCR